MSDKIIVRGRMIKCDSCMSLNPEDKTTCEIELSPEELARQLNWYELINLKQEIDNILADKIMKEKILPQPQQEFNPQSMDAVVWAKEFMRIFSIQGFKKG